jgi:hypothetical protein
MNVDYALMKFDELAKDEYKTLNLDQALAVGDELRAKRIMRLTGIMMKQPVATPSEVDPTSNPTGAYRRWEYKGENEKASTWALLCYVYQSQRQGKDPAALHHGNLDAYLRDQWSELNWFEALLGAVQPLLCANSGFKGAIGVVADKGWDFGAEALVGAILHSVPELDVSTETKVVAAGLGMFVAHYAKQGFCDADFHTKIVEPLSGLRGD